MAFLDDIVTNLIYIEAAVIIAVAIILERSIAHHIKRVSRQKEWPPHVTNGLVLIFRLLILLGGIATLMSIGGLPPDLLVAYSALGGAAIGFASTRTIGNFVAGIFVYITHPFRVNDFVRIDNIEGVVEEITFNYTKIRTQNNTLVFISNLKILDQSVSNYRYGGEKSQLYCYSVNLSFDHSLSAEKLEKVFDSVIEKYFDKLPKKPEYVMQGITAFERRYVFYLYAKNPKEIFTIQPSFVRKVTEAWEKAKEK